MDEFKRHCEIIKELIEKGDIFPRVVNSNLVDFRYPGSSIDLWVEKNHLVRESFVRDLGQIPIFVLAALSECAHLIPSILGVFPSYVSYVVVKGV